jgi:hypothetical protein
VIAARLCGHAWRIIDLFRCGRVHRRASQQHTDLRILVLRESTAPLRHVQATTSAPWCPGNGLESSLSRAFMSVLCSRSIFPLASAEACQPPPTLTSPERARMCYRYGQPSAERDSEWKHIMLSLPTLSAEGSLRRNHVLCHSG